MEPEALRRAVAAVSPEMRDNLVHILNEIGNPAALLPGVGGEPAPGVARSAPAAPTSAETLAGLCKSFEADSGQPAGARKTYLELSYEAAGKNDPGLMQSQSMMAVHKSNATSNNLDKIPKLGDPERKQLSSSDVPLSSLQSSSVGPPCVASPRKN